MNTKINDDPVRYELSQTTVKKGLFSKKEIVRCALGDENGDPLTPFEYGNISQYTDGFAETLYKPGTTSVCVASIDINGKFMLRKYNDSGYHVKWDNGYFLITRWNGYKGLATREEKVLIEPQDNNYLEITGDIVLYGNMAGGAGPDYNDMGIGKLAGDALIPVIPRRYNHVQYIDGRVVCAGRYAVNKTRTAASLTTDKVTVTARLAFQLFSVDTGKLNDLVFGEIHKTDNGNYSAVVYPNIRPEELLHRQTVGEAFSGEGLLDFSGEKRVVLNERFEFPNAK